MERQGVAGGGGGVEHAQCSPEQYRISRSNLKFGRGPVSPPPHSALCIHPPPPTTGQCTNAFARRSHICSAEFT